MNRPGDAGGAWRREKRDELEKSKDGEERRKKGLQQILTAPGPEPERVVCLCLWPCAFAG
jgi:hypothetical protein